MTRTRRNHGAAFKAQVAFAAVKGDKTLAELATHSRREPIRKAVETVRRHIDHILTYFQHPVTNAMSEVLNSHIQKIKSMACGFRNTEHLKTAICFRFGGLDLCPC